ncbi:uncharacterized protein LOC110203354 [Phascolarctos cinereus]|uniref:RNA polymerase II degradation factor 1-like n=1 Tax=Phascolarctos cinereus TaxID=38626 RepID=A0A6P5JMT6_PHACI|nr:RNA polymerase II degradation factor 1-like [Phascolarctos cinereus]
MSGDLPEANEEWRWSSQPPLSLPKESCEGKMPETSSEELSPNPDRKAETSPPPEMDPKDNSKGKGKGDSGAKGGQQGSVPKWYKMKGEDLQGNWSDLAKIEQKVDTLLEKMDLYNKEGGPPPQAAEEAKKIPQPPQPQPPQPQQPQQPPPVPPLPTRQEQALPQQQHHGGKGQKKFKGYIKGAPTEVGGGGSGGGGAVGKFA